MNAKQDCLQCGRCCQKWGWDQKGVIEDLIPWILGSRKDILQHVGIRFCDGTGMIGRDLKMDDLPRVVRIDYWVSHTGRRLRYCPFLLRSDDGKVYCQIHTAKPEVCKRFAPWSEGIRNYALNCPACRDGAP